MEDPIFGLVTPSGIAGIAILRLSGLNILTLLLPLVRTTRGEPVVATHWQPRRLQLMDWSGPEDGDEILDRLLMVHFPAPHSYTGEEMVELHCHGSLAVVRGIVEDLVFRGVRPAEPGEFSRRAFLNGKIDLAQAVAILGLIEAGSRRAAREAARQMNGSLSVWMERQQSALVAVLAHMEASLDFAEEEITPHNRATLLQSLASCRSELASLLQTAAYGRQLRDGFELVISGRPNVGKSSLFNRLVGTDRAIVTAIPGTTRDLIENRIRVGGFAVLLVDSAGIRPSSDPIEEMGIRLAETKMREADGLLYVVDAVTGITEEDIHLLATSVTSHRLLVINKCDLVAEAILETILARARGLHLATVLASCHTGVGIGEILAAIPDFIRQEGHHGEGVIIMAARQQEILIRAIGALDVASDLLSRVMPMEVAVIPVRLAMEALGEMVGKVTYEKLLDTIFGQFCIGK